MKLLILSGTRSTAAGQYQKQYSKCKIINEDDSNGSYDSEKKKKRRIQKNFRCLTQFQRGASYKLFSVATKRKLNGTGDDPLSHNIPCIKQ
jgi:hypothetical protein